MSGADAPAIHDLLANTTSSQLSTDADRHLCARIAISASPEARALAPEPDRESGEDNGSERKRQHDDPTADVRPDSLRRQQAQREGEASSACDEERDETWRRTQITVDSRAPDRPQGSHHADDTQDDIQRTRRSWHGNDLIGPAGLGQVADDGPRCEKSSGASEKRASHDRIPPARHSHIVARRPRKPPGTLGTVVVEP